MGIAANSAILAIVLGTISVICVSWNRIFSEVEQNFRLAFFCLESEPSSLCSVS